MLFLDGVYVERPDDTPRFRGVKAPSSAELARRPGPWRSASAGIWNGRGMLERGAENSCLAGDGLEAGPMGQLLGSSITYRIVMRK